MSDLLKRTFGLGKAYLNTVRDRIDREMSGQERALDELDSGRRGERGTDADDLLRRAQEKIDSVRRQADSQRETVPDTAAVKPTDTAQMALGLTPEEASAYRILGVAVGADLGTVQAAYTKLSARCDPRRYPDQSAEQEQAKAILEKVNQAMDTLRRRLDPTNHRFGKLELE